MEALEGRTLLTTLALDPVAPIDEGGTATLAGSVSGLEPGFRYELEIDWGDGTAAQRVEGTVDPDGNGSFSVPHIYRDDDPGGTPADDYSISVRLTEETVILSPDAIFVVDVSGSAEDRFGGTPVGDQNGDGLFDRILDAEIAGFKALNQELVDRGLGDTSRVSVTAFAGSGTIVDMDPSRPGVQPFTTPLADNDGDGVRDVDQALMGLRASGSTNFEAALRTAIQTLDLVGTAPGLGNVIFLSDGASNDGGGFIDEAETIKGAPRGHNLRAFGVGPGASLFQLQQIDPDAVRFNTTDELLDGLIGSVGDVGQVGGGTDQQSATVRVSNLAPALTLEPVSVGISGVATLRGTISDAGVLDSFELAVDWGDPASADNVVTVLLPAGTTSFVLTHAYADPTPAGSVISATLTDDDTGADSASVIVTERATFDVIDVLVDVGAIAPISVLDETRTLPWLGIEALTVVLEGDVAVGQADLGLSGLFAGSYDTTGFTASFDPTSGRTTATWTLPPLGAGGGGVERLTLGLGDFTRIYDLLPGDFSGDGIVTIRDAVGVRDHLPAFGAYLAWADLDGDGDVDFVDMNHSRRRIGTSLPPRS